MKKPSGSGDKVLRALSKLVHADGANSFACKIRDEFEGNLINPGKTGDAVNEFVYAAFEFLFGTQSIEYADAIFYAFDDTKSLERCIRLYDAFKLHAVVKDSQYPWVCLDLARVYIAQNRHGEALQLLRRVYAYDRKFKINDLFQSSDHYSEKEMHETCMKELGGMERPVEL